MSPLRPWIALPLLCAALVFGPHPASAGPATTAELRRAIEHDQDRLKDLLRTPREEGRFADLHRDPELRELAQRLPQLQQAYREAEARESGTPPAGR